MRIIGPPVRATNGIGGGRGRRSWCEEQDGRGALVPEVLCGRRRSSQRGARLSRLSDARTRAAAVRSRSAPAVACHESGLLRPSGGASRCTHADMRDGPLPRVPNHDVVAVRVANLEEKARLLAAEPAAFFTEPHYNGFPAILVRLDAISVADLKRLIAAAWQCRAPVDLTQRTGRPRRAPRP